MIEYDCHLHSAFSTDSDTPMEKQIYRAKAAGLRGVCLTDHMDYDFPGDEWPDVDAPFVFDPVSYLRHIEEMKNKFEDIEILAGVECGLQKFPSTKEKLDELKNMGAWDFRIGSLHLIEGKDPYYPAFWEGRDAEDCLRAYFEETYENLLLFHDFESLGHLDYAVRYAPSAYLYTPEVFFDVIDAILSFLIQKDIALEINTSGLKTGRNMPNPHWEILSRYVQLGGRLITIGSDAHTPEYVGYHFREIGDPIKKTGLQEYVVYRNCKPVFHKIC